MKRWRSFIRQEPRKLGKGWIIACMILSLVVLSFLKTRFCPVIVNLQGPMKANVKMLMVEDEDTETEMEVKKPICDVSGPRSDVCDIEGDIRVKGNCTTISIPKSKGEWRIRPYPRKGDTVAMARVSKLSLGSLHGDEHQPPPHCTQNHTVPAIIFSVGGFTGNLFHDFTDVLIPLFITSHQFNGQVQFLVTDSKPWWLGKYHLILKQLSKYEVIEIDHDENVHCFPRLIAGTSFHKELGIDPSKSTNGYSMLDFKELLMKSFSLGRGTAVRIGGDQVDYKRPKLLIISRKRSRVFVNERGIVEMSKSLGYDVVVAEANTGTDISKFARLVNSCDVMIGVHGAGLTNMVFLPQGAVLIQVIPLGGLEWLARSSFKEPSIGMKVKYLEYKIQEEESTLIEQYPHDHPVLKDPFSIHKQGWEAMKSVYLEKQNVKPHLGRLRNTLLEALKLLHQSP
ncbi:alpha-1,3-arabinosyltransferase XAT3-like [Tasmannia lanceolata]|uniref:alpha-1,3-arabinosyltransferase XAT3-like n=1 Tax=Tasmannia lanceolata TaxID=3420 RepID=UPI0040642207